MGDIYCRDYSDMLKYGYAPLWFAWYPVRTESGLKWLTKVHKQMQSNGATSIFGQRYMQYYDRYYDHE